MISNFSPNSSVPNLNKETLKNETILLVDDNDDDRRLMSLSLTQDGYQLLEARDGEEALQIFQNHIGKIDLVLTDIVMPKMDGFELMQVIRKSSSGGMPFIFISGYKRKWKEMMIDERGMNFVSKSHDLSSLSSKIGEVLRQNKSPLVDWFANLHAPL